MKRALCYPLKLIAKNAGVNGSVVVEKVGATIYVILAYDDFTCFWWVTFWRRPVKRESLIVIFYTFPLFNF